MNAHQKPRTMFGDGVPHRRRNIGVAAASAVLAITGLAACAAGRARLTSGADIHVGPRGSRGTCAHSHRAAGARGNRHAYRNCARISASSGAATVCQRRGCAGPVLPGHHEW